MVVDAASAPVVDQDQDFLVVDVAGAARADVDHQWAPESLDFQAGTTRQEFGATLIDDTPGEADKPFTLNWRQVTGDDHLIRGRSTCGEDHQRWRGRTRQPGDSRCQGRWRTGLRGRLPVGLRRRRGVPAGQPRIDPSIQAAERQAAERKNQFTSTEVRSECDHRTNLTQVLMPGDMVPL